MARKGLPKSIIKKYGISKKAWAVFRGSKSSKSSNPRPKKARKVKKVARRRRSRRSRSMTIPLAPVAGLVVGLTTNKLGWSPLEFALDGNFRYAAAALSQNYLGFDPISGTFDVSMMMNGTGALILGALVHKFVGGAPLNLNRVLGAAKVPLIRI